MKKSYLYVAAAALAMAACTSDELNVVGPTPQPVADGAVGFDVYTQRGITRAGLVGETTTLSIQKPVSEGGGFGVFGYYTDNNDYDQLATPNFFYNQSVKFNTTVSYWGYDPIKYWPNEYGESAVSDDADRVSFFAYAPYVEVNASSGKVTDDATYGITQLSRNTAAGDPLVKYIGSFDTNKSVDLCWGVCETNTWTTVNSGQQQQFTKGLPWLDVQRPAQASTQQAATSEERVKFTFRHALAKMKVNIDAAVDGYDAVSGVAGRDVDTNTRIWVRSVRFTGFAMKGALNLNNETPYQPYWMNYNGVGDLEADGDITVYDGRRDGKEGLNGSKATNEKLTGLNPAIVEDENCFDSNYEDWDSGCEGVNGSTKPLFDGGGVFYCIPLDDEPVEVEIVYDVETIDPNLGTLLADGKTHGSSIENRIAKTVSFGSVRSLEAGKGYVINLHLGMNSVKLDAAVADWEDIQPDTDVDLPANMPVFQAGAAGTTATAYVPGYTDGNSASNHNNYYTFAVSGLLGGEAVQAQMASYALLAVNASTYTGTGLFSKSSFTTADNQANPSGVVYVKALTYPYTGVENKAAVEDLKITSASGQEVTLKVGLLAVSLGLKEPATLTAANEFELRRVDKSSSENNLGWQETSSPGHVADFTFPLLTGFSGSEQNNYIRVWVNGAELTKADTPDDNHQFAFSTTDGKLSFNTGFIKSGDVIRVTMKAGDVAEETIRFTTE